MVTVLCAGDLHIGRRASRLPAELDGARFSAREGWHALVETALREQVDVVALSGDLVDRANRYFEALGPLEHGLRRLADAGVSVCLVAGNHDFDVLPALVDGLALEGVTLLGAGGRWQRHTITRDGSPRLHVDGWSFPAEHVRACPLDSYDLPLRDDAPTLGLLHADLDQPNSPYAPVTTVQLRQRAVAFWLLGHVHAPAWRAADGLPGLLYPGSPCALDPGEPGVHGVWLTQLTPGQPPAPRLLPLSRAYYTSLTIALDDAVEHDDARRRITGTVREHLRGLAAEHPALECASYRLTLTGRTRLHGGLETATRELLDDFTPQVGDAIGRVERIEFATRPALDLAALRGRRDALGLLAALLDDLERGEPALNGPAAAALERLRGVAALPAFEPLAVDAPHVTPAAVRDLLLREGYRLLDALDAQLARP
jgi:DNA repair exonuclease SbcCD nuclease subunit